MTKIRCNGCKHLKTIKRFVRRSKNHKCNIWTLYCTDFKGDLFIELIEIKNQDLHSGNLPEITPPFVCPLRQVARKAGAESKFELTIN